jgi:hypothetical protein
MFTFNNFITFSTCYSPIRLSKHSHLLEFWFPSRAFCRWPTRQNRCHHWPTFIFLGRVFDRQTTHHCSCLHSNIFEFLGHVSCRFSNHLGTHHCSTIWSFRSPLFFPWLHSRSILRLRKAKSSVWKKDEHPRSNQCLVVDLLYLYQVIRQTCFQVF